MKNLALVFETITQCQCYHLKKFHFLFFFLLFFVLSSLIPFLTLLFHSLDFFVFSITNKQTKSYGTVWTHLLNWVFKVKHSYCIRSSTGAHSCNICSEFNFWPSFHSNRKVWRKIIIFWFEICYNWCKKGSAKYLSWNLK